MINLQSVFHSCVNVTEISATHFLTYAHAVKIVSPAFGGDMSGCCGTHAPVHVLVFNDHTNPPFSSSTEYHSDWPHAPLDDPNEPLDARIGPQFVVCTAPDVATVDGDTQSHPDEQKLPLGTSTQYQPIPL